MLNIFKKRDDGLTDEMRYMKEVAEQRPWERVEAYSTELKIFGTLQIIENTFVNLLIVVSADNPEEMEMICDPRIIRAIKQANAIGVKIILVLPPEAYKRISHLIPEPKIYVETIDLYRLSFISADNNRMVKLVRRGELMTVFSSHPDFEMTMEIQGFLQKNKLLYVGK